MTGWTDLPGWLRFWSEGLLRASASQTEKTRQALTLTLSLWERGSDYRSHDDPVSRHFAHD